MGYIGYIYKNVEAEISRKYSSNNNNNNKFSISAEIRLLIQYKSHMSINLFPSK